ncbi:hypothetical protein GE09DRAFT_1210776 [Coniochaeta sp. 2T2.1]|nr:hypothetical protein GE09DRAFT_1210776 [Coniochaeta sp. 2T2.1]
MAIQILSDLHLESPKAYDTFEVTPSAPYLALLGDIGLAARHKDDLLAFLKRLNSASSAPWPEVLSILRDFERDVANNNSNNNNRESPPLGTFVLLDRAVFRPPDAPATVVLGCSLFSAVPPESAAAVGDGLTDFYHTGASWDVAAHNNAHARDLAWLNTRVAELENDAAGVETIVVLTHWSPTRDLCAIDSRHAGSPISSAFSTNLSSERCFTSPKVKVWAFGHTHYNCDFMVERGNGAGPLRLVTNQRGYYFQQSPGFDKMKKIDL